MRYINHTSPMERKVPNPQEIPIKLNHTPTDPPTQEILILFVGEACTFSGTAN